MSNFKIAGTVIPEPNVFNIGEFKVEKKDRLASGRLVKDTIATKHTFELSYPFLHWSNLQIILNAFEGVNEFFTFQYEDKGAVQTATVSASELPRQLMRTNPTVADWLYRDVRIALEEQ